MHGIWTNAIDAFVTWTSVSLVSYNLCKHGWMDQGLVWVDALGEPRNVGQIQCSFHQCTLATCLLTYWNIVVIVEGWQIWWSLTEKNCLRLKVWTQEPSTLLLLRHTSECLLTRSDILPAGVTRYRSVVYEFIAPKTHLFSKCFPS